MFVGVIVDSFQTSGNSVGDSDAAKEKRRAYERKQAQKVVQQQERFEQCVAPPAAIPCVAVACVAVACVAIACVAVACVPLLDGLG